MISNKIGVGSNLRLEFLDMFLTHKPDLDCLEIICENWFSKGPHHEKLSLLKNSYEILFHSVGMNIGGVDPINFSYLDKISDLIKIYKPTHLTDHLCFQKNNNYNHHDLLPIAYNLPNLNRIADRINSIQDHLGIKIGLENLSYYVEYKDSNMSEADFLNELCKKSGCFLLLDLNNIFVNEVNLNITASSFLNSINFEYVKEVHLAGATKGDKLTVDDHGANISESVFELLNKILPSLKNINIIYERDSNLPDFQDHLLQLKTIQEKVKAL